MGDSALLTAPTELPSVDPPPSKLPTEMPLEPRDHATTTRSSLKLTAPGTSRPDSALLTSPTELPSADPPPSKLPTEMPLEPRDPAITTRNFEQLDCFL